jgi:site-specific DNA recombinase
MHRIAIWTAVSTEAQAAGDKISLAEQETRCREAAQARAWRETAGPYVVPGESRTRWVNLRDAEQAIPALHTMLDDAQRGRFDLLVMYDYNRLRDLLDPVAKTLSHYGVQIYSISQPVEPLPRGEFNPYASDTANIMQGMSRIISQAQIADLRRKYRYAMPRRAAERGLPVQIPFGYRKPPGRESDRGAIPVQDPHQATLLLRARDMLLAGKSLMQIAEMLEESGERPPGGGKRWYPQTIRDMLRNPFYAGYVRWGMSRSRLDPRTGKRTRDRKVPADKTIVAQGRHQPLWDEDTHRQLTAELSRRAKKYKGKKTNQFTGLLSCAECGASLWTFYDGRFGAGDPVHVWRCSSRERHVVISHAKALELISRELQQAIAQSGSIRLPRPAGAPDYTGQLAELKQRRRRLEDGYLSGLFSLESFSGRAADLDRQIDQAQRAAAVQTDAQAERSARLAALNNLVSLINEIPNYLAEGDPQEINRLLHLLLEHVIIKSDLTVELAFR